MKDNKKFLLLNLILNKPWQQLSIYTTVRKQYRKCSVEINKKVDLYHRK